MNQQDIDKEKFRKQVQDIRPTIERYFEKHGFDLGNDNDISELCDKICYDMTDLYYVALFLRDRLVAKKHTTKADMNAIHAIVDWLHDFRNKH